VKSYGTTSQKKGKESSNKENPGTIFFSNLSFAQVSKWRNLDPSYSLTRLLAADLRLFLGVPEPVTSLHRLLAGGRSRDTTNIDMHQLRFFPAVHDFEQRTIQLVCMKAPVSWAYGSPPLGIHLLLKVLNSLEYLLLYVFAAVDSSNTLQMHIFVITNLLWFFWIKVNLGLLSEAKVKGYVTLSYYVKVGSSRPSLGHRRPCVKTCLRQPRDCSSGTV